MSFYLGWCTACEGFQDISQSKTFITMGETVSQFWHIFFGKIFLKSVRTLSSVLKVMEMQSQIMNVFDYLKVSRGIFKNISRCQTGLLEINCNLKFPNIF